MCNTDSKYSPMNWLVSFAFTFLSLEHWLDYDPSEIYHIRWDIIIFENTFVHQKRSIAHILTSDVTLLVQGVRLGGTQMLHHPFPDRLLDYLIILVDESHALEHTFDEALPAKKGVKCKYKFTGSIYNTCFDLPWCYRYHRRSSPLAPAPHYDSRRRSLWRTREYSVGFQLY